MAITDKLTAIANAIRSKTGESGTMKLADMPSKIASIKTKETVTWHQCPEAVRNYLDNVTYNPADYSTTQINNYAPATAVVSNTKPIGKSVDGVTYYNNIPNVDTPFSTTNTAGTVKPLDRLRWINALDAANVRDLGGWDCDGGTVKYGLLIRGGEIDATHDHSAFIKDLQIRRELNLRGAETTNETSVFGDGVYFYRPPIFNQYTLNNAYMYDTLKFIFDGVIHNEPIYFHCMAGADRTGTLALILEALLGVSQSDCDKDYELTMFSNALLQRTRNNTTMYKKLIDDVVALSGDTFRNKIVNYVLSKGFTVDEINDFRNAMIDGTPSQFNGVTNNLTHCTTNNNANIVWSGGYTATITADTGYTLNGADITVTMGGVNITSTAYNNGVINIPNVTGSIVITINAVEYVPSYTNLADPSSPDWMEGYRLNSSGTTTAEAGTTTFNYIPCVSGDTIRIRGTKNTKARVALYSGSHHIEVANTLAQGSTHWNYSVSGGIITINITTTKTISEFRFCDVKTGSSSDVVITRNEEIT